MAAALLATRLSHGRLASPFTAREVDRQEWTGLTEPRVVQGALESLEELGWIRSEAVRAPDGERVRVWSSPASPSCPKLSVGAMALSVLGMVGAGMILTMGVVAFYRGRLHFRSIG